MQHGSRPTLAARAAPVRRVAAVNVGKQTRRLTRALGRGGGTSLPGLLAERIDPTLLGALAGDLAHGCMLITGTNGKTTTTRIIADAARRSGWTVLSNREGSNLLRGVASVLVDHADRAGRLHLGPESMGIFEMDEGALPGAIVALKPRVLLFTNLFRDQLDRYFEVDFVARLWSVAMANLPASTTLVLNADDPQVAFLGEAAAGRVIYYGLDDVRHGQPSLEHAADARRCPRCSVDLVYERTFYAHLGHYACPHCGWQRPKPDISAWRVDLDSLQGSELEAATPTGDVLFHVGLAGLYNAYNALAAVAGAHALNIEQTVVQQAVGAAREAFGRLERFQVGDKQACLILVKNPTGYNQALRLVLDDKDGEAKGLLLALNDAGPDGRDVSWIWDVDLERCADAAFVVVAGDRATDLALRLKYGEVTRALSERSAGGDESLIIEEDVVQAFWRGLDRTPPGGTLYVLPTYTAMWTLREHLAREGYLQTFWRHGEPLVGAA